VGVACYRNRFIVGCALTIKERGFIINPGVMSFCDENKEFYLDVPSSTKVLTVIVIVRAMFLHQVSLLNKDMMKILSSEETSDVKIICEEKEFKCCRNILCARSETFKDMLLGDTKENATGEVVIKDSTIEAVEVMLKHIYTSGIPSYLGQEEALSLLRVPDMYCLDSLKFECADNIVTRLGVSNCIHNFITMSRYFSSDPANLCRQMVNKCMRSKAEEVTEQDDWKESVKEYPDVDVEIVKAMVQG